MFRLVVGLGNPGREYAATRHNVGFMIVDRLAAARRASFHLEKAWKIELARAGAAWLCKPLTYMNLSGQAVRAIAQFHKIEPDETLVVLDDMALPLGKLRLRSSGSSGGHNGLQSVIEHLGTSSVPRLRVGITQANPGEAVGHVLGKFAPDEVPLLEETLDRAVAAIDFADEHGIAAAMNKFN